MNGMNGITPKERLRRMCSKLPSGRPVYLGLFDSINAGVESLSTDEAITGERMELFERAIDALCSLANGFTLLVRQTNGPREVAALLDLERRALALTQLGVLGASAAAVEAAVAEAEQWLKASRDAARKKEEATNRLAAWQRQQKLRQEAAKLPADQIVALCERENNVSLTLGADSSIEARPVGRLDFGNRIRLDVKRNEVIAYLRAREVSERV
jgi:hypothetical protein